MSRNEDCQQQKQPQASSSSSAAAAASAKEEQAAADTTASSSNAATAAAGVAAAERAQQQPQRPARKATTKAKAKTKAAKGPAEERKHRSQLHVQVLSAHSLETSPSLMLSLNAANSRYLFNAPDGLFRICVQDRVHVARAKHIFLGGLQDDASGLGSVLLGAADARVGQVTVHGPGDLDFLLASKRFCLTRSNLTVALDELPPPPADAPPPTEFTPMYTDDHIAVYAFMSIPESAGAQAELDGGGESDDDERPTKRVRRASPAPRRKRSPSPERIYALRFPGWSPRAADASCDGYEPFANVSSADARAWRRRVLETMFSQQAGGDEAVPLEKEAYRASRQFFNQLTKNGLPRLPQTTYSSTTHDRGFRMGQVAVSYLVKSTQIRGTFLPRKAMERGVKPGPSFAQLVAGKKVWVPSATTATNAKSDTSHDESKLSKKEIKRRSQARKGSSSSNTSEGQPPEGVGEGYWVEPRECMTEGKPGEAFVVVNLPDPALIESFTRRMPASFVASPPHATLTAVYWLLGEGVSIDTDESLRAWREALGPNVVHHVTTKGQDDHYAYPHAALLQFCLGQLSPDMFPLPRLAAPAAVAPVKSERLLPKAPRGSEHLDECRRNLSPPAAERAAIAKYGEETWQCYKEAAARVRGELEQAEQAYSPREGVDDFAITMLGTASAVPSKYRNVSGILLHWPTRYGMRYILLDAGEGTLGQLIRRFGQEETDKILAKLTLCHVSHLHYDHQAGLYKLLKYRAELGRREVDVEPMAIFSDQRLHISIREEQRLLTDAAVMNTQDIFLKMPGAPPPEILAALDLRELKFVNVEHRCACFGIVLQSKHFDLKVVYSGDTMPSDKLIEAGQGATVLIHEATIEDDKPELARAKGHSTFGQAIDVAARMKARNVLLTHFSARYPKLPPVAFESRSPKVAVAFDYMTIRTRDFDKFHKLVEPMELLFGAAGDTRDDESAVLSDLPTP